ncbi:hypothetical protein BGZ65_005680 [Modicella reniformis]|uniref:Uncharacterized protein n=1 Tax=Modicella reniformis TaxID=1440133 RepID=A0A9P6IXK5_9FUNG|nr:hypothetical protein BGZ65_005680 [Modicella reniformis]
MKYTVILAALTALVQAAPLISYGGEPIADSYIVVLKNGITTDSFKATFDETATSQNDHNRKLTIHYKYNSIGGFAATISQGALQEVLASKDVAYVERDGVVTIQGIQRSPPSWGLPRISERKLDISRPYVYNNAAGKGITAYIIDTGVYIKHKEFGSRAKWGANFITNSTDTDENGHGTHVAGTIGGTTYGVAKKVSLVGVKVLDASGSGTFSSVIAGIDWVVKNGVSGKSVVNMSLGGIKSKAVDDAAERLFLANIPLIAAAGNSATDSCTGSPSGAPNTFTVAASDKNDHVADFSSFGKCVETYAPGVNITSAWIGSSSATNTISGTSMAAPHVAGVAALYMSFNSLPTAKSVFDKLTSTATTGKITGDLKGSPNRLVFSFFGCTV